MMECMVETGKGEKTKLKKKIIYKPLDSIWRNVWWKHIRERKLKIKKKNLNVPRLHH